MKTLLRLGGVLLVVVSAWVAVPAQAGGPTSVLLSAPAIRTVAATGYGDAKYDALMDAVGMQAKNHPGWKADEGYGPVVRATWLIHDMSVWRLDLIYPDAEGGPWVATFENSATGEMPDKPVWHPAADGQALTKVLDEFGLLSGKSSDGATPEAAVTEDLPAAAATTSDSNAFTGWRWALPGALAGAVLALVAVRTWPRRRWELIDQE